MPANEIIFDLQTQHVDRQVFFVGFVYSETEQNPFISV